MRAKGNRMDEHRKNAYRYLLYWALLEIRCLSWRPLKFFRMLNPLEWMKVIRRIHRAGDIADWLHNLAAFSSGDFEGFNEEWFWRGLDNLSKQHPDYELMQYKEIFEEWLAELKQQSSAD